MGFEENSRYTSLMSSCVAVTYQNDKLVFARIELSTILYSRVLITTEVKQFFGLLS